MIDLNKVRINIERYKNDCKNKNKLIDVDMVLQIDDNRKKLQKEIDDMKHKQKDLSTSKDYDGAKKIKNLIQSKEEEYKENQKKYDELIIQMPNFIHPDVPVGKDESGNIPIKYFGNIPKFDFEPLDHITLMKKHNMIDTERGVKISGARSYFLLGDGALLENAIIQLAYKKMIKKGFTPLYVPNLVLPEILTCTGYYPDPDGNVYELGNDKKCLIGTAEIPITSYHKDEILQEEDLPKKYFGKSECYRREAGSYGKDTSGLYRVHQFGKVEQVVIINDDEVLSNQRHNQILENSIEFLEELELPFRLLQLCTGDLALGKYNSHDIECRMPSRNSYGETHSATSFLDFQARRLNLRYRDKEGKIKYCYTLNNTLVATPRILIPIIENNQTKDGKIKIPKILQEFIGKDIIG